MATPAEIANDLAAQAKFWRGRDDQVSFVCRDCASLIRQMRDGHRINKWTYDAVERRLLENLSRYKSQGNTSISYSMARGLQTMTELRAVAG